MKTRLVLWGTDADDKKVMLAIALRAADNKVDIWAFPEEVATESFYKHMIDEWRFGKEMAFPDTFTQYEVPFSSAGDLLPDGLKPDRGDLIQQAQTEWQFVILSSKLYETYQDELQFIKDKLERLDGFDQKVWEELKGFWEKVQGQIHERVLFRDHASKLRDKVNGLFDQMKTMRRSMDAEFKTVSKEAVERFSSAIEQIEERIKEDRGLHPIFEELKKLQREYHDTKFTRDDRNRIWKRLDAAFKAVKEKRFGKEGTKSGSGSPLGRLERRLEGLKVAINKMEKSIQHDQRDIDFEQNRIEESHGQLEAQIRQAKLAMIDERIKSKQEKLTDMLKTQTDLEGRIERERKREEARKEKEEREHLKEQIEESLKEKIAEEIKHAAEVREGEHDRLEKAAEEIVEAKKKPRPPKETIVAATEVISEALEDISDTVRATADVVTDRIREIFEGEDEEE